MPIAYTFTPLDGGAHVFTAKLTTAGVKVWRVLDSSNPTVAPEEFVIIASDAVAFGGARTQPPAPSTGAIVMMPAPIARASAILSITAPLHVTVGTTFLVTIAVLDAAGAPQLSFRDTVRLNSTGAALLPDNYSFTAADAAVHSFSVVLLSPGTHILSVQDVRIPPSVRTSRRSRRPPAALWCRACPFSPNLARPRARPWPLRRFVLRAGNCSQGAAP